MPETGFQLRRIREHLRRRWALYLAGAVLLCLVNNLIYTMTRPRFSDDEILRVMLLNVDVALSDEDYAQLSMELLSQIQAADADVQILEFEPLIGVTDANPQAMALLFAKLTGGFGDVYLSDEAGLKLLAERGACLDLGDVDLPGWTNVEYTDPATGETCVAGLKTLRCRISGGPACLSVMANGTDIEGAKTALPSLARALQEE